MGGGPTIPVAILTGAQPPPYSPLQNVSLDICGNAGSRRLPCICSRHHSDQNITESSQFSCLGGDIVLLFSILTYFAMRFKCLNFPLVLLCLG